MHSQCGSQWTLRHSSLCTAGQGAASLWDTAGHCRKGKVKSGKSCTGSPKLLPRNSPHHISLAKASYMSTFNSRVQSQHKLRRKKARNISRTAQVTTTLLVTKHSVILLPTCKAHSRCPCRKIPRSIWPQQQAQDPGSRGDDAQYFLWQMWTWVLLSRDKLVRKTSYFPQHIQYTMMKWG